MSGLAIRVLVAIGVLAGAYFLWHSDREAYAKGKVQALQDRINAMSAQLDAARAVAKAAKEIAVEEAQADFQRDMRALEKERDEKAALVVSRQLVIDRLRASAADRPVQVSPAAGDACRAEIVRRQQVEVLLYDGQRLAIEGAGLLDEAAKLVGSCQGVVGEQSALIRLAQRYAKAVEIIFPEP